MRAFELTENKITSPEFKALLTPDVRRLGKTFEQAGFEIRIVGGAVRDLLIGKIPKDTDMATTATPEQMIELLDSAGIRYEPTGLKHGTISAIINGEAYEITTLRIDKSTDGRHAEVEFTTDWQQDAERRDLSYNAMSLGFDGTLYDYFGGQEDLKNHFTRFVGNAERRIQEDYLRILRYFRFIGRQKSLNWDTKTLATIKANAEGLKQISGERIWAEIEKILHGNHVVEILEKLRDTNVATAIGLPVGNLSRVEKLTSQAQVNPIVVLTALIPTLQDLERIRTRWKFDNSTFDTIAFIITHRDAETTIDSAKRDILLNKGSPMHWINLFEYFGETKWASEISTWVIPNFPISGKDFLDKGFKMGPDIGKKLAHLKQAWVNSGLTMSREELLAQI